MLYNEIIKRVTKENIERVTKHLVTGFWYWNKDEKPTPEELVWLEPFLTYYGGRDGNGALTTPAGDTEELKRKFKTFWENEAKSSWALYIDQWFTAMVENRYGHAKRAAQMFSVLCATPDAEHLIAFLAERFPGTEAEEAYRAIVKYL